MSKLTRLAALTTLAVLPAAARADLIAYYPFEGNVNNVAPGYVGTHNGGVVGPTLTAAGHTGQAYQFDGANDYISLDTLDINPAALPKLTMGAWVKSERRNGIQQVISHDNSGYDRSFGIDSRNASNGNYNFSTFTGTGVLNSNTYSTDWTFLTAVYDQPAGTVKLYVNGASAAAANSTFGSGWNFTRIGASPSFTEYFQGTIDDVFFYNEALAADEILSLYTNGIRAALVGDTNDDGVVDLVDLNNVLNNFGDTGASPGDDNNDGVVDLVDLNNVLNNFGNTATAAAVAVVPEPSAAAAACLVAAFPLLTRLRRSPVQGR